MKKRSLLLLTLLLAGGLVACNRDGTETTDPDDTTVETMEETEPETAPPVGTYLVDLKYECGEYIVANYNILNFGAKGDGVTDDTAAFKAAIEEARENGGGTIFVPEGIYCLYEPLTLDHGISLVGELEIGTTTGTTFYIYHGKNDPDGTPMFSICSGSSLRNVAIYYPEQKLTDGEVIPYSWLIKQQGDGPVVENITVVNAYKGIDYSGSLQTARNVYGTFLNLAFHLDANWDIGKLENSCFSPKYWLEYDPETAPDKAELESYMLANATGMKIGRMDWTYFADIVIEGYHIGYHAYQSEAGLSHGHLYRMDLLDCYYPLYLESIANYGYILTDCTLTAKGDAGATAVLTSSLFDASLSFNNCTVTSEGDYAIHNPGYGSVATVDCTLSAANDVYYTENGRSSFINSTAEGKTTLTADLPKHDASADHDRFVITKPASTAFVNLGEAPYNIQDQEDITLKLQAAIDSLKGTGGMVYIPKGTYYVEDAITVHAGIELRGPVDVPHFLIGETATIYTSFGENDPDGEALFTLMDGAGARGFNVFYTKQTSSEPIPYSFTFRGNGKNVYICNLLLPLSYNTIDLATYRCDNHYVEYLWAAPVNTGIWVGGGSENGIVRDCHFTPNCNGHLYFHTTRQISSIFKVGESTNQIFYHNFSYGGAKGLHITDGAKDCHMIANGIDCGTMAIYLEGDCDVQFVNTQAVILPYSEWEGKALDTYYLYSDESFTGNVEFINTNLWGVPGRICSLLEGNGNVTMVGGRVNDSGWTMLQADGGNTTLAAIYNGPIYGFDVIAGKDIESFTLIGNLFSSNKFRTRGVDEKKLIGFEQ